MRDGSQLRATCSQTLVLSPVAWPGRKRRLHFPAAEILNIHKMDLKDQKLESATATICCCRPRLLGLAVAGEMPPDAQRSVILRPGAAHSPALLLPFHLFPPSLPLRRLRLLLEPRKRSLSPRRHPLVPLSLPVAQAGSQPDRLSSETAWRCKGSSWSRLLPTAHKRTAPLAAPAVARWPCMAAWPVVGGFGSGQAPTCLGQRPKWGQGCLGDLQVPPWIARAMEEQYRTKTTSPLRPFGCEFLRRCRHHPPTHQ